MYLGAIFGIDVGGSLTKIVYFETHPSMTSTTQLNPMNSHHAMDHTSQPSSNHDNVEDMTKISQIESKMTNNILTFHISLPSPIFI